MPFGLRKPPLLSPEQWSTYSKMQRCDTYCRKLVVLRHSQNFTEHLGHLEDVSSRLKTASYKIRPSKRFPGRFKIAFFRHRVSAEGVQPSPAKVGAVKDFPVPTSLVLWSLSLDSRVTTAYTSQITRKSSMPLLAYWKNTPFHMEHRAKGFFQYNENLAVLIQRTKG